jgi:hypothetical protein
MWASKGWSATILLAVLAVALVALRLHYGAIAVALVSAGLAVVWAQLRWASARWSLAVVAPVAVAYAFYGLHFWMLTVTGPYPEGYVGSYVAWAFLGLAEWGIAGAIVSLLATTTLASRRRDATPRL